MKRIIFAAAGVAALGVSAANINMTDTDTSGESSLNSAGKWSVPAAPTPGNTYFTAGKNLRLNAACEGATFAGDALYINGGTLVFQGATTVTIPDLHTVMNGNSGGNLSSWYGLASEYDPEKHGHKLYGKLTIETTNNDSGQNTGPGNDTERCRGIGICSEVHGAANAVFRTYASGNASYDPGPGWAVVTSWLGDLSNYAGWITSRGNPEKNYYGVTSFGSATALSTFKGKLRLWTEGALRIEAAAFTDGVARLAPGTAASFLAVDANATGYLWLPAGTETRLELDVKNSSGTAAGGTLALRGAAKVVFKDHAVNLAGLAVTNGVAAFENATVATGCAVTTGRDGALMVDTATFANGFRLTPDIRFLPPEGGFTLDNSSEIGALACVLPDGDGDYGRVLTLAGAARLAEKVRVGVTLAAEKNVYRPDREYLLMVVPAACGAVTADMFETEVLRNGALPQLFPDYSLKTFGRVRVETDGAGDQRVILTSTGIDWAVDTPVANESYMDGVHNRSGLPLAAGINYFADRAQVSSLTIRTPDVHESVFAGARLALCNNVQMALKCAWLEADIDIVNSASIVSWQSNHADGQAFQGMRGTLNLVGAPVASESLSFLIQNNRDIRVDSEITGDARQIILAKSSSTATPDRSRLYLNGLNTNYFGQVRVNTHNSRDPVEQQQCDVVITREANLGGRLPAFTAAAVRLQGYGGLRVEAGDAEIADPNRGVTVYAGRLIAEPGARLALKSTTALRDPGILVVRGGGTVAVGGTAETATDDATVSVAEGTTFEPLAGLCFTNATVNLESGVRVLFNRAACDAACMDNGWINLKSFTAAGPITLAVSSVEERAFRTLSLPLFTVRAEDAEALLPNLPAKFDCLDTFRPIYAVEDVEMDDTTLKRIVATFRGIRATVLCIR